MHYIQENTITDIRVNTLMLMDDIAYKFNDTEYTDFWMMYGVPNGAYIQDFIDIAEDDDEFNRITDFFTRLIKEVAKDGGLYGANEKELQYAKKLAPEIENN